MVAFPFMTLPVTDCLWEASGCDLALSGFVYRLRMAMWATPGGTVPADNTWIAIKLNLDNSVVPGMVAQALQAGMIENRSGRLASKVVDKGLNRVEKVTADKRRRIADAARRRAEGGPSKPLKDKDEHSAYTDTESDTELNHIRPPLISPKTADDLDAPFDTPRPPQADPDNEPF